MFWELSKSTVADRATKEVSITTDTVGVSTQFERHTAHAAANIFTPAHSKAEDRKVFIAVRESS